MKSLHRSLTAAGLCGLLALAGCSSDEGSGDAPPPSTTDTTSAPQDLTYRTVGGLRVPMSRIDGPAKTSPPEGYSHTPQGAALAAANGQAALAVAPDSMWAETVRTVTAPGKGRDEFAYARTLLSVKGSVPAGQAAEFVGFRITDYQPERAIVLLATRTPQAGGPPLLTAYPVQTVWSGGDWKLVLPQQADGIDAAEIRTLDGFTTWEKEK